MIKLLGAFFLLANSAVFSQISTDSLLNELRHSAKYKHVGAEEYLMKFFQRFKSSDGTECYDVYLNRHKKLKEYIGLSIVYKQFDKQNRIIKTIGYNAKGNYSYWDYSPIELTTYSKDTVSKDFYNRHYILTGRSALVKDSLGRPVAELSYNEQLCLVFKTVTLYSDALGEVWISYYDGNGNFRPNDLGVSILKQKFNPIEKYIKTEEYFYDSCIRLVDANHDNIGKEMGLVLNYSQKIDRTEDGTTIKFYYNSCGKIVAREMLGSIIVTLQRTD